MDNKYKYFYCGGAKEGFNENDIDIYRRIDSNKNGYVGFYMFDDEYREYAFMDAYNKNMKEGSNDNGVGVIVMDSNLRYYEVPPVMVKRITKDLIDKLRAVGYDLIVGRTLGKREYILINTDKVKGLGFIGEYNGKRKIR